MYSGLLPVGVSEDELSPDDEEGEEQKDDEQEDNKEKCCSNILNSEAANSDFVVERQSSNTTVDSQTTSLPGVSQEMLQKFEELRKKKAEVMKMKYPEKRRRRRRHKKGSKDEKPAETRKHQEKREKHWNELKQYFGEHDRFHPPVCSKSSTKSGLEESMERAIAEGDIAKAEEMSDRLATREMAVKIAQAADSRDFVKHKQTEDAVRAQRKRNKQLAWGFEAKRRWETKSNMGFM